MQQPLPPLFVERMKQIIPEKHYDSAMASFFSSPALCVRENTLKVKEGEFAEILKKKNIVFRKICWAKEAFILEGGSLEEMGLTELEEEGKIYRQGLSSMLPVIFLDVRPGDYVLDMCAAPGSKATQMAARMGNRGKIVCVEAVRGRYYKLKSVARLLGAENMTFHLTDARRFHPQNQLFDKILVDAPCSSEGRFKGDSPKTIAYWSPRKIKEMVRKQKGLALAASRLLQPGGEMVYSTCTFAPEENEAVVQWLLKKTEGTLVLQKAFLPEVASYPALLGWKEKAFEEQIQNCLRVLPGGEMEGFFIAKFQKKH